MQLISVSDVAEGEMIPRALLNVNRLHALDPTVDEQSHLFRLAIPLLHWGQVWDHVNNGRRWGFKWLFICIRFTDIVYSDEHIWRIEPYSYVGLMK